MNLVQHVNGPTHEIGHTLDLVITGEMDSVLLGPPLIGCFISDHAIVNYSLNSVKPKLSIKSITYRKIKDVDIKLFKDELSSYDLIKDVRLPSNLDVLVGKYNSSLSPSY